MRPDVDLDLVEDMLVARIVHRLVITGGPVTEAMSLEMLDLVRDVRLHRVHDELREADPHVTTVSQVAGRWGFLYLGRFAAAYREKFGERPSDTLRSS